MSRRVEVLAAALRSTVLPRHRPQLSIAATRCEACYARPGRPSWTQQRQVQTSIRANSSARGKASSAEEQAVVESSLLAHLKERGLLQELTSRAVHQHVEQGARTIYLGVDPSASSLHVGNLLPLLALIHFTIFGHRALLLVGGATGSIGDPSGRSSERNALDPETLKLNVASIQRQVNTVLENVKGYLKRRNASASRDLEIQVINNADWYQGVGILEFLSSVGRYARISDMLARDSVASRLGLRPTPGEEGSNKSPPGMSFTEFTYQLLQAFDFSVLHDGPQKCTLQLGGSDQMGNIMAGVELIMRKNVLARERNLAGEEPLPAYGVTVPLLTTSTGVKFGKSAGNAIWLDPMRLSDLDFYQYFWRSADADVEKYLKALTLLPMSEIDAVLARHAQDPSKRVAQTALAENILELVRGPEAVNRAQAASEVLFAKDIASLDPAKVKMAFEGDPRLQLLSRSSYDGLTLHDLCASTAATQSKSEARRLIQQGGVQLNGKQIKDISYKISADADLLHDQWALLKIGKAGHRILFIGS